ncbi:MAG: hypothetical protein QOH09_1540 [Pseudonocardiales bacterium]|jgi:mannitol 2-dehydrogenase|nr:hypothetical protein [Pseudonocardiales bacterium]
MGDRCPEPVPPPFEPRVIGSIVEYLFAPDEPEAVIEKLVDEQTG